MENKAKKASNEQKDYLIQYMENNIEFANDRFESVDGAHLRAQKWDDLAATLNGLGGAVKNASKWRKYWADQRSQAKNREVLRRASVQKSGINGLARLREPSEFDKRVLQLMAPVIVTGSEHVPELINISLTHREEMQLEFLESECEDINGQHILPATELPSALPQPAPPSPPRSSAKLRSSLIRKRKRNARPNSSFEEQLIEIEEKKLKLMEENNVIQRENVEVKREKLVAEKKWREQKYELEVRRLQILEAQTKLTENQK